MTEDTFTIQDNLIVCHSKSGSTYKLTKTNNSIYCTCSGFAFRRTCRHIKEVIKTNLLYKLEQQSIKSKTITSPITINARRKALEQYLKRNGIETNPIMIKTIEPTINQQTSPKKILNWALTFLKT